MNNGQLEKYSSAITLSDMEIFVFPELMYSLVLANIMSPVIWRWRDEKCFKKLDGKGSYKKLLRLKQFILDNYEFNLDLETWGLTRQETELKRFEDHISPEQIANSNALFGYHGDEYYFDVDIRRHFGLDKYDSDIIPYWKTETVEAMDSFALKTSYKTGAGECVSLAGLYAAAAFIVCQIPLEDIYMILTPLHSQNFIDINGGVLTNNRRIVTKNMWFNGTALSNKAQRALRNEQITIVAHNTGNIHCLYDEATIDEVGYEGFLNKLNDFVSSSVTRLTLANFLRFNHEYQKYFQFCCAGCKGGAKFVRAEVLYHYEHGSRYRIADATHEKLIQEVSNEDLIPDKVSDRMCCKQLCAFIEYENLDIHKESERQKICEYLAPFVPDAAGFLDKLADFLHFVPQSPLNDKKFIDSMPINISVEQSREEIIEYLQSIRDRNATANLAFYTFRDMESCRWAPFVKAAIERNPVSIEKTESMDTDEIYSWLLEMGDESIYSGNRLAAPDEVVNFGTGDGLEKCFLLANIMHKRNPEQNIEINVNKSKVKLESELNFDFETSKNLSKKIVISGSHIAEFD
ncbi:MAG: hypothetical protein ISS77_04520 [Phycisphaerae bacterium]|nr:hypothetical protein [Phycisphaerae bacterium]